MVAIVENEPLSAPSSVFISYARSTSFSAAESLYRALGGADGPGFLDTEGIAEGEHFPKKLAKAILGARVFVAFIDEAYFRRWVCLRELQTALAPFNSLLRRAEQEADRLEASLRHIIIALPQGGVGELLNGLPPFLRATNWPKATATEDLVRLTRERLQESSKTLGQQLDQLDARAIAELLLVETALPPPQRMPRPHFPITLPPSLNSRFVGRADDLFRIHFSLTTLRGEPARTAALTGAVGGGGGFGKTRVALEYAWRFGPTFFPGGIFWLTADQTESGLQRQFHGMLRELKSATPELHLFLQAGRDARKELGNALADAGSGEPVLFIVDNLPHDSSLPPRPITDYCPAVGMVTVLVTSRVRVAEGYVKSLDLDVLNRPAAIDLLTEGPELRRCLSDAQWSEIAAWVGDLPLALEVLNSALHFKAITPHELWAKCKFESPSEQVDRQMEALRGQVPPGSLRGVTEALALSYEALAPEVRSASRMIAWFAAEPIPVELFHALGTDVDTSNIRTALTARSFLSARGGHDQGVDVLGTMHRVTADYIRSRIKTPRAELQRVCRALGKVMTKERCADPTHWPLMNACIGHAEGVFFRAIRQEGVLDSANASLSALFTRAARQLLRREGLAEQIIGVGFCGRNFRYEQALYDDAERYAQALLDFSRRIYRNGVDLVTPMLSVADVIRERERIWWDDPTGTAYSAARRLEEEAVGICLTSLGEHHQGTINALNNLSVTLSCQNDFKEARRVLEKVVAFDRQNLGEDDRETITAMHNLAIVQWKCGDVDAGTSLMRRVLDLYRSARGDLHPDTLRTLGWLASMEADAPRSIQLHTQAVDLYRKAGSLGDRHPMTVNEIARLAHAYKGVGSYEVAAKLFQEEISLRRQIHGNDHPRTLNAIEFLGQTYYAAGDYESAKQALGEAVRLREEFQGKDNPRTLYASHRLAWALYDLRDYHAAAFRFQDVFVARRRILGEKDEETLRTASALGDALCQLKDLEGAQELLENTLELRLGALGPDHTQMAFTYRALGRTYAAMGRFDDALRLLSKALDLRKRKLEAHHLLTTLTAWDTFELLERMNDPVSLRVFEENLKWLMTTKAEDLHPDLRILVGKIGLRHGPKLPPDSVSAPV
jgi:tetratricopeptide (TPR) repeat protein